METEQETKPEVTPEAKAAEEKKASEEKAESYSRRVQKSIDRATGQAREAERQLEAANQRITALEEKTQLKAEPDPDDYSDHTKLVEDQQQWKEQETAKIRNDERQKIQKEQSERQWQQQQQEVSAKYAMKRDTELKKDAAFGTAETNVGGFLNSYGAVKTRDAILKANNSTEIIKHLNGDSEKLQGIVNLAPEDQMYAIWELDKELEAEPVKKVSTAPDPARDKPGSAPINTNDAQLSQFDFNRKHNGFT